MSEAAAYGAAMLRARSQVVAAERVFAEASRALSSAVAQVSLAQGLVETAEAALATEWPSGGSVGGVEMWRRGLRAAAAEAAAALAQADAERETRQRAKRAAESARSAAQAKLNALEKALERKAHQRQIERRRRQDQDP